MIFLPQIWAGLPATPCSPKNQRVMMVEHLLLDNLATALQQKGIREAY